MIAEVENPYLAITSDTAGIWDCLGAFEPSDNPLHIEYCREHVRDQRGRPYDHRKFPHIGAPGGPADAFDFHDIRDIVMQWATRLGKSFTAASLLLRTAHLHPVQIFVASSDKIVATDISGRFQKQARQIPELAERIPTRNRWEAFDLGFCDAFTGWSRSVSSLADKDATVGWGNEYSKWITPRTSNEANARKLWDERFKDNNSVRKRAIESTPTIAGLCPTEELRLQGSDCTYQVPCPHCRTYQRLSFGDEETTFGVKWSGRSVSQVKASAHYCCEYCEEELKDSDRHWMMRRGVWCPSGCTVISEKALEVAERRMEHLAELDLLKFQKPINWARIQEIRKAERFDGWENAEWVEGEPRNAGSDIASYQLSTLYGLSSSWSEIALEFLRSKDKPGKLQNFTNSWLGKTWSKHKQEQDWSVLQAKIHSTVPHRIVPDTASLITIGADRQLKTHPYVIEAWSPTDNPYRPISHMLDYGRVSTLEDLADVFAQVFVYETADDPVLVPTIKPSIMFIDARYNPQPVYVFAREMQRKQIRIYPSHGANRELDSVARLGRLGARTSMPGLPKVDVCTSATQFALEEMIGDYAGKTFRVYQRAAGHQELCEELLNEYQNTELDEKGSLRTEWERITETPNDFRAAKRYSYAAMMLRTQSKGPGARRRRPLRQIEQPRQQQEQEQETDWNTGSRFSNWL